MTGFRTALMVLALAVAGCSSDTQETQAPTEDPCIADPAAPGCQPPTPPNVEMAGLPTQAAAYAQVPFSWSIQNNSVLGGHSPLTSVRVSNASVAETSLSGPDSFGYEVARHEHQDLPVTYQGTFQVKQPGTVFVRAYATIGGTDYWSTEAAVIIGPVKPTGVVKTITHTAGAFAGTMEPAEVMLQLGDGIVLANDDAIDHIFTFDPPVHDSVAVNAQSASKPIIFLEPGTVRINSDDAQPLQATVDVRVPS